MLSPGCGRGAGPIPAVDGPLVLEVRYPTAAPIAVTDSVSIWGTLGTGKARLDVNGQPVRVEPNGAFATFVPLPVSGPPVLELEARLGDSTLRRSIRVNRVEPRPSAPDPVRPASGWVRLRRLPNDSLDGPTQARPIYSRWLPGGALAVALPQGVRLPVEAATDAAFRVGLAKGIAVWVPREDTQSIPEPHPTLVRLSKPALETTARGPVIALEAPERVAAQVEVVGERMRWTLFNATGPGGSVGGAGGLVRRAAARDHRDGRVVVDVELAGPPLGWRTSWAGGRMLLEVRPTPRPDAGLAGLVVAIDPGHPPLGSTGPAGLREDSVTLAVARAAVRRLEALGARPVLTRQDAGPVSLDQRMALAEAADVQVFVSIHVNAPGDGRPPESVDGTRVFYQDPIAVPLARALRDSVAAAMRQTPVATIQTDLAVLRATWYPGALVEATALSMPVREAYLRSPEGVEAYAAGVVGGLQTWVAKFR